MQRRGPRGPQPRRGAPTIINQFSPEGGWPGPPRKGRWANEYPSRLSEAPPPQPTTSTFIFSSSSWPVERGAGGLEPPAPGREEADVGVYGALGCDDADDSGRDGVDEDLWSSDEEDCR